MSKITYRLRQWYPGLPESCKKRTVLVKYSEAHSKYVERNRRSKVRLSVDQSVVEDNPNFWVPHKRSDYEVLEIVPKAEETLFGDPTTPRDNSKSIAELRQNNYWDIVKVRRTSDGEIFKIGDKVREKAPITKSEIKEFEVVTDNYQLIALLENGDHLDIKEITHGSVFKVKTYEGAQVNNPRRAVYFVDYQYKCNVVTAEEYHKNLRNAKSKVFYEKPNAHKYIERHRPKYSQEQVEELVTKHLPSFWADSVLKDLDES